MKRWLMTVGVIILLGGVSFTFASHDVHNLVLGFSEGHIHTPEREEHGSHDTHQTTGLVVAIIGLGIAFIGWKIR